MRHVLNTLSALLLLAAASIASAETLTIDNFSTYNTTTDLQKSWGSFGSAASSGPAALATGKGESGSNAALFQLNWDAGNNANMRLSTLPEGLKDISGYSAITLTLRLADDAQGYAQPATPTALRIAIQGGSDKTIWQTSTESRASVANGNTVTVTINLSEQEMTRESGRSSLRDALSDVSEIRLRFENGQAPNARQDAYIDSIVLSK